MIPCCALSATGEVTWVLTTMPSATASVQEACGFTRPGGPIIARCRAVGHATSTRHCRQAPTGVEQRVVAEPRDLHADLLGGADHQGALGHADLDAVDGQRDQVGLLDAVGSRWSSLS